MVNGREIKNELLRIRQIIRNTSLEDFDSTMEECGYKEERTLSQEAFAVQNYIKKQMKNYGEYSRKNYGGYAQKNYNESRSKVTEKETKDNKFDLNHYRVGAA